MFWVSATRYYVLGFKADVPWFLGVILELLSVLRDPAPVPFRCWFRCCLYLGICSRASAGFRVRSMPPMSLRDDLSYAGANCSS